MSKKKRSRVQSWPRWLISTVAGILMSALAAFAAIIGFGATIIEAMIVGLPVLGAVAIAGMVSTFFEGLLTAVLEGLSMVMAVVLAPLALLGSCG